MLWDCFEEFNLYGRTRIVHEAEQVRIGDHGIDEHQLFVHILPELVDGSDQSIFLLDIFFLDKIKINTNKIFVRQVKL